MWNPFRSKEQDMAVITNTVGTAVDPYGSSMLDPGHTHGIAAMTNAQLQAYQNSMMNQMANQIGNSSYHGGSQPAPQPAPKKAQSWNVNIVKVENGFMVTVTDYVTNKSLQYIASDISNVTEMIAAGLVTGRMES